MRKQNTELRSVRIITDADLGAANKQVTEVTWTADRLEREGVGGELETDAMPWAREMST